MATAKITKKALQQDEFIEGVFDFGEWLEVHWKKVLIALGVVVAVVLLGVLWNGMRERSSAEANRLLASGLGAFSLEAGANGQAPAPRYDEALSFFEQAAASGGSQNVGDIARLFRARALIALSRSAEAVPVLDGLVATRNKALAAESQVVLAEALEATGNFDRAAKLLEDLAAAPKGAPYPQDAALLLLGGLRERQGKPDDAKKVYADLLARYPQSPFAGDARQRTTALTLSTR
jgi:tetratricopeptide (TPR) repeat protein